MRKVTLAIALAALVLFAGCNKDKETQGTTLKASIEQQKGNGSKTSLNPTNGAINWTTDDKILVYNGTSATFTLSAGAGSTNGTFNYAGEFEITDDTKAVYPKADFVSFDGSNVSITLPSEQTLTTLGTFANGANPMMGVYNGDGLSFTSLCGVLGLSLKAEDDESIVPITAIEIVSNNPDDKLNGTYSCIAANPVLAKDGTDGTNRIRLNCPAGTVLTSTPKEFFIVLPAGTLADESGFTLNLYNGETTPFFTKERPSALPMEANWVKKLNTLDVQGDANNIVMERKYLVHHHLYSYSYYSYPTITLSFSNGKGISIGYYNAEWWNGSYGYSIHGVHIISGDKDWYITPDVTDVWVTEKIIVNPESGYVKYFMNGEYMGEESFAEQLDLSEAETLQVTMNPYGWWTGHYTLVDDFVLRTPATTVIDNFDEGIIDLNIWNAPAKPSGVYVQDGVLNLRQRETDQDFRIHSKPIAVY